MNSKDAALIYTQYRDKVFGFVRSKVLNQTEAEDITQNVFVKVCANLDKYDEAKASLSTWIYTITRNTVFDYLKKKRDHPMLELMDDAISSEEEPDEAMLNSESLEELASALEKLPQNQRDIIILLYYKKLDRKNTAEMLGMTYGQLRYLHDKAIRRLGELYVLKKQNKKQEDNKMSEFLNAVRTAADGSLNGVSDAVILAMIVVGGLLIIASIVALVISIFLAISYIKYNRRQNSAGKTGEEIARTILDKNGLQQIKVSKNGSILFGNSYSHYFKKVRLRRLTWQKKSVTSLAMAAQKSSLAVMDKENDPDMRKLVRLTPFIYLGPLAFIPMVIIGALLDVLVLKSSGATCMIVCTVLGLAFYLASFVMSILVLKTEKKAQKRAYEIMKADGLATAEELESCKKLFKLYNIEYINNMIIALLELVYRVLQIIAYVQNASSSSSSSN